MKIISVYFGSGTGFEDTLEEIKFDSKKSTSFPLLKDLNPKFIPTIQTFLTLSSFKQSIMKHECIKPGCFQCESRKLFELSSVDTESLSCGTLQNFIENQPIQLEGCEEISTFLTMIHGNNKTKCNPKCELHQIFPIFKRELSCNCGGFSGTLANDMLTSIDISLAKLVNPLNSRMSECSSSKYQTFAEISTLKKLKSQFANIIKTIFQAKKPTFFKCLNSQNHDPSFNIKSNSIDTSLLILKFDWSNVEQNTFNSMQSLIWLDGQLDLSVFSSCHSSSNLGLKTIFLTKNNKGKVISFIDNSWFKLSTKRNFQICKGRWIDTLFYIISHRYMPLYVFYEKIDVSPIIKLEPIEIGMIEFVSYQAELGENFKHGISKIYNVLDKGIPPSVYISKCVFCHNVKKLGEACEFCGFINGDWNCKKCLEFNKQILWTCRKCRADRINIDFDFTCEECLKTSVNLNFCKYCPATLCYICGKEMFSFEEIFCTVCKKYTIPFYECSLENHIVLCADCKLLAD